MKLLSIIIPNYNYGQFLEDCLISVERELTDEIEVVFVDGGSQDESLEIAQRYSHIIDVFISEKDEGQSDAINKGVSRARSNFVTWLNSDDILIKGSISEILNDLKRYPQSGWFAGSSVWLDVQLRLIKVSQNSGWSEMLAHWNALTVYGPSSIFRKKLFLSVGGLDKTLHYTMDSDLWQKFRRKGLRFRVMDVYIFGLRLHELAKVSGPGIRRGDIKSDPNFKKYQTEKSRVRSTYGLASYGGIFDQIIKYYERFKRYAILKAFYLNFRYKSKHVDLISLNKKSIETTNE